VRRARAAVLIVAAMVAAGCIHYPSVEDIGGIRITPQNGRAVRQPDGARVFLELNSTGKFGDRLTAAFSPVAREAQVVTPDGSVTDHVNVPGATVVALSPSGPHVVLSGLTRPLVAGESIIVTLMFEKSGGIGVITVVE
jgi:periplasmic copper chaperone A